MTLLYIGMGVDGNFSPKPLVVIFFRAPGRRGLYRKLLEPTQRPTNPYMGWATPPTSTLAATEDSSSGKGCRRLPFVLCRAAAEACVDHGWGRRGRLAAPLLRLDGSSPAAARRGGPRRRRTRRPHPFPFCLARRRLGRRARRR
jgi:hypothetical protein